MWTEIWNLGKSQGGSEAEDVISVPTDLAGGAEVQHIKQEPADPTQQTGKVEVKF